VININQERARIQDGSNDDKAKDKKTMQEKFFNKIKWAKEIK